MGQGNTGAGEASAGGDLRFDEILTNNPLFNMFDNIDNATRNMQKGLKNLIVSSIREFPDPPAAEHLFSNEGTPGINIVVPASMVQKYECMDPFFFDFEMQRNFLSDLIFRSPFSQIKAILLEICTPRGSAGVIKKRYPEQQHYWWRSKPPHKRFHPEFIYQVKTILLLTEEDDRGNENE